MTSIRLALFVCFPDTFEDKVDLDWFWATETHRQELIKLVQRELISMWMRRRLESVNWKLKHGPPGLGRQRFGI